MEITLTTSKLKFTLAANAAVLPPQTSAILKHLKQVGDISGVEAQAMYRARSVTKRISEINDFLFAAGGPEVMVQGQWSRDNTGQRYKRYVMPTPVRHALGFEHVAGG